MYSDLKVCLVDEAIDDAMGGSEDEEESEEVMNQVYIGKATDNCMNNTLMIHIMTKGT
jgi:hypothetical protein